MADPNAAARRASSWVLLDAKAYIGRCNNATTAMALTSTGAAVEVSFSVADPQGVSRCFVHYTGMAPGTWVSHASALSAEGGLLVLGVYFTSRIDPRLLMPRGEFFVYRSGNNKQPSLHRLPEPYPLHFRTNSVGIVLLDGEDEYVLVHPVDQLEPRGGWYDLHLFSSSRDNAWSVKVARVDLDDGETDVGNLVVHEPSKVMAVGDGGTLAWIDLWQGVLTCNPLDPEPVMRLIQLPEPRPSNAVMNRATGYDGICPRPIRDVTFVSRDDGGVVARFLEIESLKQNCRSDADADTSDEDCRSDDEACTCNYSWTATMCERLVSSGEWWSVCFEVGSSDISVTGDGDHSCLRCLLPEDEMGRDELNEQNCYKVVTAAPTLGLHDDGHVLYMMSKLRGEDPKAWVLAFNTRTKKLEALAEFCAERIFYFSPTYLPCVFSNCRSTEEQL